MGRKRIHPLDEQFKNDKRISHKLFMIMKKISKFQETEDMNLEDADKNKLKDINNTFSELLFKYKHGESDS